MPLWTKNKIVTNIDQIEAFGHCYKFHYYKLRLSVIAINFIAILSVIIEINIAIALSS